MSKYLPATLGIAAMLLASTALAKERSELEKSSIKAATDCVAKAALNSPNITKLYREDRLDDVTNWIVLKSNACDNPIRSMRLLHDRLYGAGTGRAFLLGDYLNDLPRAVRARISDEMEKRMAGESFAYAPLSPAQGGQLSAGTELMVRDIAANDVLNIREYATSNSTIVGIIPPNSRGVTYLGETQGEWLFVRYLNRAEGWVHRRYVQPVTSRGRLLQ
jgi:uncharacterized protein YgiM (DUF1202 family)